MELLLLLLLLLLYVEFGILYIWIEGRLQAFI